ncbi:hypothetical protein [Pedobacter punctiformis]|uniref:Leucine-rich repeat domain-containing protein n=1 Tax=Pedobacter punctiformis TaxID=3004097 RepID=A0ABT4LBM8_9SPHI|nr:hypothetical protein [Pedobacter sp. HCMS5-2]MCZ4245326.1 hypothetical protein [Pedobacter sp. HCMS5-2]
MKLKQLICLILFKLTFSTFAMSQENNQFLMMNYHQFIETKGLVDGDKYESIYIFNDSALVFPVLNGENLPTNGVAFEIPSWINKFKIVKSISLIGLYIYDLPKEIYTLDHLEDLTLSLAKNCDINKIAEKIGGIKKLKRVLINGSALSQEQFELLKSKLPKIKLTDGMEDLNGYNY